MTKFKNFLGNFGYSGLLIILACGVTILKTWQLDNDTWFILNCGRYVVETGTIPHIEFATMHENLHYVMEQWLTAAIFWKIFSNFGADGLIFFTWLTGFILMLVYFKLCLYVSGGNEKISAIMACVIGAFVTNAFIVTRPQVLSTLILLVEIFLLEKFTREKKLWTLCILPLISVVFINLHAALFPMLIVVMLPFIAENLYLKIKSAREFEVPILPLIVAAFGVVAAGFINPYGAEAVTFIFTSYDPAIHRMILEVKPTAANNAVSIVFFIFAGLSIVAHCKRKLPLRYFFLTFGMMILGFFAFRNTFLFLVLGTFPLAYAAKDFRPFDEIFNLRYKLFIPLFVICAAEIYPLYLCAENSTSEMHLPTKIILVMAAVFLACFTFFYRREGKLFSEKIFILRRKPLIALAVFQMMILFSYVAFSTPISKYEPYKPAVEFLLSKNRAEDIILWTGFNSGGYFEFYGIKNYIDARPEIFALSNNQQKDIIREYFALTMGDLDYREFFSRYDFTHIFLTTDEIVPYLMLSNDENYRVLFEYDFVNFGGKCHGKIFSAVK